MLGKDVHPQALPGAPWRAGLHPRPELQGSPPPASCPPAPRGTAGGWACLELGAALGQSALLGGIPGIRHSSELRGSFLNSSRQAWGQRLPAPLWVSLWAKRLVQRTPPS